MISNRELFAFIAGGVTGAVTCYFCVKSKFEQQVNEEIATVKEYYKATTGYSSPEEELPEELKKADAPKNSLEKGLRYHKEDDTDTVDYTKFYAKKETKAVEEDLEVEDLKKAEPTTGKHVIFSDDYGQMDGVKEGGTVTYCTVDQTIVFDDGRIIKDGIEFLGDGNEDRFGEEEDNILYIRDLDANVDYEVVYEELTSEEYLEG